MTSDCALQAVAEDIQKELEVGFGDEAKCLPDEEILQVIAPVIKKLYQKAYRNALKDVLRVLEEVDKEAIMPGS